MNVKNSILELLVSNGFAMNETDTVDSFDYKVIRARWSPEDDLYKFNILKNDKSDNALSESAEEKKKYSEHLLAKETDGLFLVNYRPSDIGDETNGNMKQPTGFFSQRGMVVDINNKRIVYPGNPWINVVTDKDDFNVLTTMMVNGCDEWNFQAPIEGATTIVFYSREHDDIFFGTNHRVLKLSKILLGEGGSRWNFCDRNKFVIHEAVVQVFLDIAVVFQCHDYENKKFDYETIKGLLRETFFETEDLVYTGILSGRPFASQSCTLEEEEYADVSYDLTSVIRPEYNPETKRTYFHEVEQEDKTLSFIRQLFNEYSVDMTKFNKSLEEFQESHRLAMESDKLVKDVEDILAIGSINHNGSRAIVMYRTPYSFFREKVVRGGGQNETNEIRKFFPVHRNRNFSLPANIRERVQQIITLSVRGEHHHEYAFSIDALDTKEAQELGKRVQNRMMSLIDASLQVSFNHWKDVAFPLTVFKSTQENDENPRSLKTTTDRRLCNSLVVLFACVSKGLRDAVVDEIARYFISRMMIATVAFLPQKVFERRVESYMKSTGSSVQEDGKVPVGVHKIQKIIGDRKPSNPSVHKYRIAYNLSSTTALDIKFMMAFAMHPLGTNPGSYTLPPNSY